MPKGIELYGCREGNLQGIDVTIPYGKLTVVTGISGSGKSCLVFRTVFAEARRRIVESLDFRESYFLSSMGAPRLDFALGLPPAIAIKQTQHVRNPRSTVGSISHVNAFIYVLFATCGDIPCGTCAEVGLIQINPPHALRCPRCRSPVTRLPPAAFSNSSPFGMCSECGGTGVVETVDETKIYPDQELSIAQGGLRYGGPVRGTMKFTFFEKFLAQFGFSIDTPIRDLSQEAKAALLYGVQRSRKFRVEFPGIVPMLMKALKETRSEQVRLGLQQFVVESTCPICSGYGINPTAAAVTLGGVTIHEILSMEIVTLTRKLKSLRFEDIRSEIAPIALRKAIEITNIMIDLGIGYLSLSRKTASLSGGEMHRARMAAQLASQLSGVVYVLDEPTSGVHAEEVGALVSVMRKLRDLGSGNTILVVEHDADVIWSADHVIELGPGASRNGGRVVCVGSPSDLVGVQGSLTGWLLSSPAQAVKRRRLPVSEESIGIRHARSNNLKDVSVDIPLHSLVAVTGLSGSGKSSLVFDLVAGYASAERSRTRSRVRCEVVGRDRVDDIVLSDQAPITRSSRSVVATIIDVLSRIRVLFSKTDDARKLHLDERHFSFNTPFGCCQSCGGRGTIEPDNVLLEGVRFTCPACGGSRFVDTVLSCRLRGRSISDVLDMDVTEALDFFGESPPIRQKLEVVDAVGLGYLRLGQESVDLSGGEAQRLKLAVDLMSGRCKRALYIFDEPTAGLHARDIQILVGVFDRLLEAGNSIVVVEHNLHLVWASDFVIEMGPGAGEDGGRVVATGTPGEIAYTDTATGRALRRFLG
jgi:excinuclease ABC subunit A